MTRLAAVCSLILPARVIADVGCDHGRVAEYVFDSHLSERVIASDISERCLEKAKKRLGGTSVEFAVCDGLAYECDEAIIAGMGGVAISDIIENAVHKPDVLILCPHRDCELVRRVAIKNGYAIDVDMLTKERGRIYTVLRARKAGEAVCLSDLQYKFGTEFDKPNALLRELLLAEYGVCMKAQEQNKAKLISLKAAMKAQGMPEAQK